VTIASPKGARCELDAHSDPRDESGYSADDLITMGFLSTASLVALLEDTPKLADFDLERFDAIVVCGGQSRLRWSSGRPQGRQRLSVGGRPSSPSRRRRRSGETGRVHA
jgi:hypothetical protein